MAVQSLRMPRTSWPSWTAPTAWCSFLSEGSSTRWRRCWRRFARSMFRKWLTRRRLATRHGIATMHPMRAADVHAESVESAAGLSCEYRRHTSKRSHMQTRSHMHAITPTHIRLGGSGSGRHLGWLRRPAKDIPDARPVYFSLLAMRLLECCRVSCV